VAEQGGLALDRVGGARVRLARPPAAFREQIGAHVWIAGEPAGAVASYGIIRPRG